MSICAKSNIFVLIGSPGSGKGSFSDLCIKNFGWSQLSTGNLCRKHIATGTEIGKHIDFTIKSGKLVSDAVIVEMVKEWLTEQLNFGNNVLLDGYPRNLIQAKALQDMLDASGFDKKCFHVVKFTVSDEVVLNRLTSRLVCKDKNCQAVYSVAKGSALQPKIDMVCDRCSGQLEIRADDNVETIKERLRVYSDHEGALLGFYKNNNKNLIELDASMPIDDVFNSFKNIVGL